MTVGNLRMVKYTTLKKHLLWLGCISCHLSSIICQLSTSSFFPYLATMSKRFDLIARQLLQKDLAQCTTDELVQYAEAHPFLAAAHFLLVKKLHQQQDPAFKIKAQKAALYYYQPVAFEAFLTADDNAFEPPVPAEPDPVTEEQMLQQEATAAPLQPEATAPPVAAPPTAHENDNEARIDTTAEAPVAPESAPAEQATQSGLPAPQPGNEVAADALLFEPFHTVDYFASQGIKLSQEEIPKDKFGKQLMSFTAWLKTMKKLPAAEAAKSMDPQAEQKVEHLAAHSVSSPEVVTETMAEVWMKQGQPQKAAEVYHKLSLLYPSKKVYFAAKLEDLKQ